MAEEIGLQIMDYQYKDGDNIADLTTATSAAASWTVISATSASFSALGSPSTQFINNFVPTVTGVEYNLSFRITNYSGSGSVGFSTNGGVPSSARRTSNGTTTATFIATGSPLDIFGRNTSTVFTIDQISVSPVTEVDVQKSIIGELDISSHNDFPLALTFNIADYKSVEARKGSFSKTFIIPATKNNNSLLKNIYIPNSTFSGNPITEQKRCRIMVGRLYSIEGLLKISASTTEKYPSSYSCVFYGDNTNWTTLLDQAKLKDVPLGGTTTGLEIKKDSIMDSWSQVDATTTTSPLVYPLVSYGDFNPTVRFPGCVQLLRDDCPATAGGGNSGGAYIGHKTGGSVFNSSLVPSVDWRVCIWAYDLFKAIFKNVGYTISSTFIESSLFKQLLYASPNMKYNNPSQRWLDYSFQCSGDDHLYAGTITTSSGGHTPTWSNTFYKTVNMDDCSDFLLINDESGGFDTGTGYWTVPEYGLYNLSVESIEVQVGGVYGVDSFGTSSAPTKINIKIYFVKKTRGQTFWGGMYDSEGNPSYVQTTVELYDDNATLTATNVGHFYENWKPGKLEVNGVYLNKGDIIRLRVQTRHKYLGSTTPSATYPQFQYLVRKVAGQYAIEFQPEIPAYGQTYDLTNIIPEEHTQIDFIKGIAHAFNLQFQTDEKHKVITIEPFNDFYKDLGLAIDWTPKIDRSSEIKDEWVKSELKRDMVFKYKSDSNDKAGKDNIESWWGGIEDIYPYSETLSNAFNIGKVEFTNPFFSGTWSARDTDAIFDQGVTPRITPSIGMLSTEPISNSPLNAVTPPYRADKGYSFQPRLLYYNQYVRATAIGGVFSNSMLIQEWGQPGGSFSTPNNITEFGFDASGVANTLLPQAASFSTQNINIPNLCYGNIWVNQYNPDTGNFSGTQEVHKGLYETYYRGMIEITKSNPRRRTCYVDLKINDIINIDFRNLIHIDGTYWRLNKIIDYAPHINTPTKVELVEWRDLGEFQSGDPTVQYTDGWYPAPTFNEV